jgi:uncharacterized protein YukE
MDDEAPVMRDYAQIWRSADKLVYSSTLDEVRSAQSLQLALGGISQLLGHAGRTYEDVERQVAGSFAGR